MKKILSLVFFLLLLAGNATAKEGWNDVTSYITNPSFMGNSKEGWTFEWIDVSSVDTDYGIQEFWNGTFRMSQTLSGIPNGRYRIGVQGFYRCANWGEAYDTHCLGEETLTAVLSANEVSKPLVSIFSEGSDEYYYDCICPESKYYPDRMSSASYFFNTLDMYHNQVVVDVTDNELVISVENTDWVEDNWVTLDNWTLEYWGEPIQMTDLTLSQTDLKLHVGESKWLTFFPTPSHAYKDEVSWTSLNRSVVSKSGTEGNGVKLSALAKGTTSIVCRDPYSGLSARCRVEVSEVPKAEGTAYDLTDFVMNPTFDSDAYGWTITVGYQNGGFQSASYTNGDAYLRGFIETWRSSGNLDAGYICQNVTGLPDGTYMFEADVVACQQNNSNPCYGASMFMTNMETGEEYTKECVTESGKPLHYQVMGVCQGGTLRIGLCVDAYRNLNWLAMDNVKLTYYGDKNPFADLVETQKSLVINEIQVANNDQYLDPSYNYGGWVELYNPTATPAHLGGLYVSDDASQLTKFQMPINAGTVNAGGYKNIWFDHNAANGNYSENASKNVNFKLNMEGGTIYLSDSEGNLIQTVSYPAATPRCSYARLNDGGQEWGTTGTPTPAESNLGSDFATERLAAPVVSCESGLFEDGESFGFSVQIPAGATLMYTTDGSVPGMRNGQESGDGRFQVDGTSIYRFCLVQDGLLPSPVVTRSFIYKNHDYYLPVLSIVTEQGNLFSGEYGVYTRGWNGTAGNGQSYACNWNRDWERPVNMELLVPEKNTDGTTSFLSVLNQEVDFEISGGWTRAYGSGVTDDRYWEMKSSFRLKADKRYEMQNELPYAVFPDKPYNKYKVWQVRNGGNDTYARIIDPALQQIVMKSGINVDCQDYQPAHVFFNGQYLGMLNIRESNNKHYGYSNFGIDTDDMDQFDLSNAQYNQKAGDEEAWLELQNRAMTLASSPTEANYERVKELLDIDEYINYMALECWIGSSDWITNTNNIKGYRSKSDQGRFRFVFFDADAAFSNNNMLSSMMGTGGGANVDDLFRNLYQYEPFRRQFLDAMSIIDGSVMEPERCRDIVNAMYNNTNRALNFEGNSTNTGVADNVSYYHNGAPLRNAASYMGAYARYGLNLNSNIGQATLLLNGQEIPTGQFDGFAYDYNENGIFLTAMAPAGYTFKGWRQYGGQADEDPSSVTLIQNGEEWEYYDQGSMDGTNWKDAGFSNAAWKTGRAPFGYAKDDSKFMASSSNTRLDYGSDSRNKRPTYYFRKQFYVDHEPTSNEQFLLDYQVDDGYAFYVNGRYVNGYRVTEGNAYYDFYTGSDQYAGDNPDTGTHSIDPSLVHKGWNVLAVEVHNNQSGSSDLYWECKLRNVVSDSAPYTTVCTDETFELSAMPVGEYSLTAAFEPITDKQQRYEAGATPIRINEVSAGNDIYINDYQKKNDWVELYNTTDEDIPLAGLYLSDNASKPQKWQMKQGVVPAHGTTVIWCDDLEPISQLHAPFKLDNADGASISIQAADGTWADRLDYLYQPRRQTYGRYPDGANYSDLLTIPTINKSNLYGLMDVAAQQAMPVEEGAVTLALAEGWNWTSHNLAENVHNSRFTSYALCIRGQRQELYNDEVLGWTGRLKTLDPAQGYKVQMKQAADITLRGQLYDNDEPVSVLTGWNWIGFPLANATTLNAALANYQPTEGDQLVGLDQFATYTRGAWAGSLSTLQPGQAYLLKSGRSQTFAWKALSRSYAKNRRYEAPMRDDTAPWMLDIHAYPNVMTLAAELSADGIDLTGGYHLGAFVGDECRGVAKLSDEVLYMNIHCEGGEQVQFRLMDAEGNVFDAQEAFRLQAQQAVGSPEAPYTLHFNARGMEDVIKDQLAATRIVRTEYFNLNGQRITRPEGVCIKKTIMSDGNVVVKKIR